MHDPRLPIEPDTLVEEAVRVYPEMVSFLRQHQIVCLQCGEPVWGTLAELIAAGGLEVEPLLRALRQHLGLAGPPA